ncbi:hypothetical protein SAMN05443245_2140 [Paraburkholderia fungorum]|uniref:Uncharacterized protein n=1 Tax=Paraburkholderia fungorum TaxID=134537 RepID=A0A1H1CGF5_9BURK|nr:hypothetical protein SAMN05443245_2140 [Paraburkholderia fungorum]
MVAAVPETAGHSRRKSAAVRENDAMSANNENVTNRAAASGVNGTPPRPGSPGAAKSFARSAKP